ncbi:hypothetical protein BH23PLA1_BH23PLA1_30620 [soil metagenome]
MARTSWPTKGPERSAPRKSRPCPGPKTPGPTLLGRYEVGIALGQGGFGTVYQGWDPQLQRRVAIKVPRHGLLSSEAEVNAFLREAQRAAQLDHPGIVPVFDVGRDGESCFIVSKLIEGQTLAHRIQTDRPAPAEAVRLVAELAEIVHYAHARGWVHRDIKPANVLLTLDGRPMLADFGLAAPLDQLRTSDCGVQGTPAYMAPEVVAQAPALNHLAGPMGHRRPDHRADIYSLGVILYLLLTGRLPFQAATIPALFEMVLRSDPTPLRLHNPTIPARLEAVCLRALARDPGARQVTAADLAEELRSAGTAGSVAPVGSLGGLVEPHRPAHSPDPSPPKPEDRRSVGVGLIASVAILALAMVVLLAFLALRREAENGLASRGPEPTTPGAGTRAEIPDPLERLRETLRDQEDRRTRVREGMRADEAQTAEPSDADGLDLPPAYATLVRKIQEARTQGDESAESTLLLNLTNELFEAGLNEQARTLAERMVYLAGKIPDRAPFAHGQLGMAQYRLGQAEKAIASYEECLKYYREFYDKLSHFPDGPVINEHRSHLARLVGLTLMRIGNANKYLERYANAQTAYDEARELFEKHDRTAELSTLLLNLGTLESSRGNHRKAIEVYESGLELARKQGNVEEESELMVNLGNAQSRAGDEDSAIASYKAAYECMPPTASYEARAAVLSNWITALVEAGQIEEARSLLPRLRRIIRPDDKDSQRIMELLEPLVDP